MLEKLFTIGPVVFVFLVLSSVMFLFLYKTWFDENKKYLNKMNGEDNETLSFENLGNQKTIKKKNKRNLS